VISLPLALSIVLSQSGNYLGLTLYLGIKKSNVMSTYYANQVKITLDLKERVGAGGCRSVIVTGLRKVRTPERPNLLDNVQCERS